MHLTKRRIYQSERKIQCYLYPLSKLRHQYLSEMVGHQEVAKISGRLFLKQICNLIWFDQSYECYVESFDFTLVFVCYYYYCSYYYYYDYWYHHHHQGYGIAAQFRALDSSIFLPHIFWSNAILSHSAVRTTSVHQVSPLSFGFSVSRLPYILPSKVFLGVLDLSTCRCVQPILFCRV
jgi:hypothetical protein